jgi:dTMP kinase
MTKTGKLVVLEGLDGSGKTVQLQLLKTALQERAVKFATADFPDYQSFFGKLAGRYLNGDFGDTNEVNPYLSALPYAGDRFLRKNQLLQWKEEGYIVLINRYVASNAAYHGVKLPPAERPVFTAWLKELEYVIYGIPREDLVIYFDNQVATAQKMVDQKAQREYTSDRRDIHERNAAYLHLVAEQYLHLCATEPHWVRLDIIDRASGTLLPPDVIHAQVIRTLAEKAIL